MKYFDIKYVSVMPSYWAELAPGQNKEELSKTITLNLIENPPAKILFIGIFICIMNILISDITTYYLIQHEPQFWVIQHWCLK